MIVKPADELRELVSNVLLAAGADERNARGVAEHLVMANLSGVDTHGVWHLEGYVKAIKADEIVPTTWPEIVRETPAHDMAVVGLVQSHHIGRLGHYVEMAAPERLISMVWAGGFGQEEPIAVPYGGRARVLHTNPIAFGFPAGEGKRMMFDFATTALSGVKVVNAQRRQEELPPGCIVDRGGNSSTDPNDFFDGGGALPFGSHKGYAFMMATEFLGRIFTGADDYADPRRAGPIMRHQGVTMIAFRADQFQPFEDYASRADEMLGRVRAIPPAPGFGEVLAPGDPEARTRAIRQRDGIPIADDVWQSITDVAASLNIEVH